MDRRFYVLLCCATVLFLLFQITKTVEKTQDLRIEKYAPKVVVKDVRSTRRFKNVIVHMDLKGAPPKIEYYEKFFELLQNLQVDGVLMEYEDMFPYEGEIEVIRRKDSYSKDEIRKIIEIATRRNLEVIPLIQTFGHLEFLLKHEKFKHLSENLNDLTAICPSDSKSFEIINEIMKQVRNLHPNSKRIHIGADEAFHIGEDKRCSDRMREEKLTKSSLKLGHIARVANLAKSNGFSDILAWYDMFEKESEESMKAVDLSGAITPVVWGYAENVAKPGYFSAGLFDRMYNVFDKFYVASAFRGAVHKDTQFMDIPRYIETHRSYTELMKQNPTPAKKLAGIFVTGWARVAHPLPLMELLPVSIPSLVADLIYINSEPADNREIWKDLKERLNCQKPHVIEGTEAEKGLENCEFDGVEVYRTIMVDWKSIMDRKKSANANDAELKKEASQVLEKLRINLEPILYRRDIDELCIQLLNGFEKS